MAELGKAKKLKCTDCSKYFEEVIKDSDVKLSTNWITGELFALLNDFKFS